MSLILNGGTKLPMVVKNRIVTLSPDGSILVEYLGLKKIRGESILDYKLQFFQ
jgi:hypothetical protein